MGNFCNLILLSVFLCSGYQLHTDAIDSLCIDIINLDACQQIDRDQQIKCQSTATKTDCVLDIDNGLPTLTLLQPEEAFLAAGLVSDKVVVIGEVIAANAPFETVILVRSSTRTDSGVNTAGLKYCHPGYDHDERITRYVLEQFDWRYINIDCSNQTLTEQKFKAMSSWYGSSCRPGKWTEDSQFDAYLKNTYSSLCELCGLSGCNVKYESPLNATLQCLENGGDLALTDRLYAQAFLQSLNNIETLEYMYLCPNGSVSATECTWTKQLNRLIVTSSDSAVNMIDYIQQKLQSYMISVESNHDPTEQYLAAVLPLSSADKINPINPPRSLKSYVAEIRSVPDASQPENLKCDPIRWSVTNEVEENKCLWLKQASLTHGLLPIINCVRSQDNDTVSNLDNIERGDADIAFIDANFGYIARRKNLSNVGYPETISTRLSKIVIAVKNDTTWYSKLSDLNGKSICLPEYGGKEWLAFMDFLRVNNLVADSTNYGQLFSDFVGDSCAPGANSKDIGISDTNEEKLCSKCYPVDDTTTAKYCNADEKNKYYDSYGALKCVEEGNGDYAVVDLNDLPSRWIYNLNAFEQYRVISKNGSLAAYPGLQVDEEAAITIIVSGEVVFRNISLNRYNDTVLFLRHMEFEFGMNLQKPFKVFEVFNHTKNLLFPDSTPGLTFSSPFNKYISNYRQLLDNSEKSNNATGGSYRITLPAAVWIVMLTALISAL